MKSFYYRSTVLLFVFLTGLFLISFLLVVNQTAKAQSGNGCGFSPGLGCPGTDYTNFGMSSNDKAATIEYDNFVSTVHSTVVRTSDGTFKVWGERMGDNKGSLTAPAELTAENYPALKGVVLKVAMGSADQNKTQGIVLTTDGLYAWSNEGGVLHEDLTVSSALQKVGVVGNGNEYGLPEGVLPRDVKMLFATARTLALTTCGGDVWVISQDGSMVGDGRSGTLISADAGKWYQVRTEDPDKGHPFLKNVVAVRGHATRDGTAGLIALKSDGTLWTWGESTFLGDGFDPDIRTRATKMELPEHPAGDIKMIGMAGTDYGSSYYVLYTSGELYALGDNSQQQLGDWTTTTRKKWVRPRYPNKSEPSVAGEVMNDIHWISPLEHGAPNFASINVLNKAWEIYNWGKDAGRMLGRDDGNANPGVPKGIYNGTDEILSVETGGHTTMLIKKCTENFGYVGHAVSGSMGIDKEGNFDTFTFETAAVQVCGAATAPVIDAVEIGGGNIFLGPDGRYCNGSSIELLPSDTDENGNFKGTFSIVSGSGTLTGEKKNVLTFTGTGNTSVTVKYVVETEDCGAEVTSERTFLTEDCSAALTLEKSGVFNDDGIGDANGDGIAQQGETITYAFTLTNTGDYWIDNLSIDDPLFAALDPVVDITLDFSEAEQEGVLQPGESATATVAYTITQEDINNGGVYNLATATGKDPDDGDVETESEDPDPLDPADPNYDDDCRTCTFTELPPKPDIQLVKTAVLDKGADDIATEGDIVTYTLKVTNTGNVTLDEITVLEDPDSDDDVVFTGDVSNIIDDLTLVQWGNGDDNEYNTEDYARTLAPGEWAEFRITYEIKQEDITAGFLWNRAVVTSNDPSDARVQAVSEDPDAPTDGDDGYDEDCPYCTVIAFPEVPAISLVKTVIFNDENDDTYAQAGETVTFTFISKNTGNVSLTDIALTEDGTTFSGAGTLEKPAFKAWFAADGTELNAEDYADELAPGESVQFTVDYALTQTDINAGSLTNQATVEGSGTDGATVSDISGNGESDDDPTKVSIPQGEVEANDDTGDAINGYTGGTVQSGDGALNVLDNDKLNGTAVDPEEVKLTRTDDAADSPLTLNADGTVDVATGTAAGAYTLAYTICEVLNPDNCSDATVTVEVAAAAIEATDDTGDAINGYTGGTVQSGDGALNVLDNDKLNGTAMDPEEVKLTRTDDAADSPLTLNADGTVDVATGTAAGAYTLDYTICEVLNPDNCSDATITVEVAAAAIKATDDTGDAVNASDGGTVQSIDGGDLKVLDNDRLNGEAVDPDKVSLTPDTAPTPASGGIKMNADGTVLVAEGTTPGIYFYPYTLCEVRNPDNCANATVKIVVKPVGAPDERTTKINTPIKSDVKANDGVSANGTTVAIDTDGENGTVTVNEDGSVTYTPDENFIGKDSYTYTLATGDVESDPVTVTITVKPVGVDDDVTTDVNSSVTTDVAENDGPSGTGTDVDIATTPTHGDVVENPDGTITYTPEKDFYGTDTYTYTLTTGDGVVSDPITVTISVEADPTVTITKTAREDEYARVGDVITYDITVTNTGDVSLTGITITDANADAGSVTPATIAVLAPGESRSATAAHTVTQEDIDAGYVYNIAQVTGKAPDGSEISDESHDPDPLDPDAPVVDECTDCTVTPIEVRPAVALVAVATNAGSGRNGAFVVGDEIEYRFTVTNMGNTTLTHFVLNDAKLGLKDVVVDETLAPGESFVRTFRYTITQEDILAKQVVTSATVSANSPTGAATNDISGDEVTNDVPTLVPVAEGPESAPDEASAPQNTPVTVKVIDNDEEGSSELDPATVRLMDPETGDEKTEVTIDGEGTYTVETDGTITFTPIREFYGESTIQYVVSDVNGLQADPATIRIEVARSQPEASDDTQEGSFNGPVQIQLVNNDKPDTAPLDPSTIEITRQPQHGTLEVGADGIVTYSPNQYYTGPDEFSYRVMDANGNWTNVATVRITVSGFHIPNIITPNGDGQNDRFVIVGLADFDKAEVLVFNRWGNEVYRSNDYKQDWDAQGISEGTYYYLITLWKDGKETVHKGWLVIKRK